MYKLIVDYVFQFWSYSLLTKAASEHGAGEGHLSHGVCGAVAGLFATITSFPFDIVRTRLIAQGYPKVKYDIKLCMN